LGPEAIKQKPSHVTCLDLGPANAVFTRGWDSKVEMSGAKAKAMKREINAQWIYPPRANRTDAFKVSEWAHRVCPGTLLRPEAAATQGFSGL
jgi:NADH:quinone reductase (non-electrogenic)